MRSRRLWSMDKQGNLVFGLRSRQLGALYAPESSWEHPVTAVIVMVVCATLDFVVFKQLFAAILYDQVLIQWLSVIGCLVAFDLAPIYLGILAKKRSQGLPFHWPAAAALALAFVIVLIGNVWLRITVKDILVPPDSADGFSVFASGGAGTQSSSAALPYAIFSSALPFATSVVSFIVSYMSSNPLRERLKTLHARQLELEEAAGQIEAILVEYQQDPDLQGRLAEADDQLYQCALTAAYEQGNFYADYVRQRIKEHMGEAAAANYLSRDCRASLLGLLEPPGVGDTLPLIQEKKEAA